MTSIDNIRCRIVHLEEEHDTKCAENERIIGAQQERRVAMECALKNARGARTKASLCLMRFEQLKYVVSVEQQRLCDERERENVAARARRYVDAQHAHDEVARFDIVTKAVQRKFDAVRECHVATDHAANRLESEALELAAKEDAASDDDCKHREKREHAIVEHKKLIGDAQTTLTDLLTVSDDDDEDASSESEYDESENCDAESDDDEDSVVAQLRALLEEGAHVPTTRIGVVVHKNDNNVQLCVLCDEERVGPRALHQCTQSERFEIVLNVVLDKLGADDVRQLVGCVYRYECDHEPVLGALDDACERTRQRTSVKTRFCTACGLQGAAPRHLHEGGCYVRWFVVTLFRWLHAMPIIEMPPLKRRAQRQRGESSKRRRVVEEHESSGDDDDESDSAAMDAASAAFDALQNRVSVLDTHVRDAIARMEYVATERHAEVLRVVRAMTQRQASSALPMPSNHMTVDRVGDDASKLCCEPSTLHRRWDDDDPVSSMMGRARDESTPGVFGACESQSVAN